MQQKRLKSLVGLKQSMDMHTRLSLLPAGNMIARRSRERSLVTASNIALVIAQTTAALQRG
jgi:hypothetical protein